MGKSATDANTTANNDYGSYEQTALGNYNSGMSAYTSNVNSQLAQGNPYESKSYLTNQNLQTSGAADSSNNAAQQQLRDTALRTGTNTAAVAGQVGADALASQRNVTNYNATRDTQNEDSWLKDQQGLTQDQLAGANSEAGVYGTSVSGDNNALSNLTSIQNSEDEDYTKLGTAAMAGAGTGLTAAFT